MNDIKTQLKLEIGQRMRAIRKSLGKTQDEMVEDFNICRANLSRIETGEISPRPEILDILKKQFNVSMTWLITGNGDMYNAPNAKTSDAGPLLETLLADDSENNPEFKEFLHDLAHFPMMKHAMLSHFLEYKARYRQILKEQFDPDGTV